MISQKRETINQIQACILQDIRQGLAAWMQAGQVEARGVHWDGKHIPKIDGKSWKPGMDILGKYILWSIPSWKHGSILFWGLLYT